MRAKKMGGRLVLVGLGDAGGVVGGGFCDGGVFANGHG